MFIGDTHTEVANRILDSSLETLLEATLAEPNTWGVLILRLMMEQTPIKDVRRGETPIGLHIRNAILFNEYNSTFFECAFRIYGAEVWGVINEELDRIADNKIYPELLVERLRKLLQHGGNHMQLFTEWAHEHMGDSLLRLLAAVSLYGDWHLSSRALLGLSSHKSLLHDELMCAARDLVLKHKELFTREELLENVNSTKVLPELRAAMFATLFDDRDDALNKQLLLLSTPSFTLDPGNATALHAVAWRIAKILPEESISLFGRRLLNISYEVFQPRETQGRWSYNFCTMLHKAASWQYFANIPKPLLVQMFRREKLSFPEALATLVKHADKDAHAEYGDDFYEAERRTWEFVNNPEYLSELMLMFSYRYVAGRPEWDRIKWTIMRFPNDVRRTCAEIAEQLNRRDREVTYPDADQLVRFLKTAWSSPEGHRSSHYKKVLVDTRNTLGLYGYYPEATRELTALIAKLGIKEPKRK